MENKSEFFVLLIGVVCNCYCVGNTDEELKSFNITTNTTIVRCGSGKFFDVKNTSTPLSGCDGYSTCVLTKDNAKYQNVLYYCRGYTNAHLNKTCLTIQANTTATFGCELNDIVVVERAWIDKFDCPNVIAQNVKIMTENVSTLCDGKSSCSIYWTGNSDLINIYYRCSAHNYTSVTTSAYLTTEVGAIVGGVLGTIVIIIVLLAIIMIRQRKHNEGRTAIKNKRRLTIMNQVYDFTARTLNSTSSSSSAHDKPMSHMTSMNSMQTRIEENSQNYHHNVDGVDNYDHSKPDLAISINVESNIYALTKDYDQFRNNFEDDTYDHTSTNRTDNNDSVGNYDMSYLQNTTEDEYNTASTVNASERDNRANYTNFEI